MLAFQKLTISKNYHKKKRSAHYVPLLVAILTIAQNAPKDIMCYGTKCPFLHVDMHKFW